MLRVSLDCEGGWRRQSGGHLGVTGKTLSRAAGKVGRGSLKLWHASPYSSLPPPALLHFAAQAREGSRSSCDARSLTTGPVGPRGAVPHGGVPEWLKGTDCKSVGDSLRWFKSNPLHQRRPPKTRSGCCRVDGTGLI
jgi:hypothetical protein